LKEEISDYSILLFFLCFSIDYLINFQKIISYKDIKIDQSFQFIIDLMDFLEEKLSEQKNLQ